MASWSVSNFLCFRDCGPKSSVSECVWFAVFTLEHLFPKQHTNTDTFLSVLCLFSDKKFTHLSLCQLVPDGQDTPHWCVDPGNMINLHVQHVSLMLYGAFETFGNAWYAVANSVLYYHYMQNEFYFQSHSAKLKRWDKSRLNFHQIGFSQWVVNAEVKIHLDPTRGGVSHL